MMKPFAFIKGLIALIYTVLLVSCGENGIIPHRAVTDWHKEMAAYLKSIDPYGRIVTTSVSHREIEGLYALEELDLNQMHVYKRTRHIPEEILIYTEKYHKPFSWMWR